MASDAHIKKSTKFFGIIFIVAFVLLRVFSMHTSTATLQVKDQIVDVEVATLPYEIYKGLGGRDHIGNSDAMLFVFPNVGKHGIEMRDMKFPIDIVWLYNGKVIDIAPNVQTQSGVSKDDLVRYYPRVDANAVLEFPAGWTDKYGLKIGDNVEEIES